jgi:hypothetical protein
MLFWVLVVVAAALYGAMMVFTAPVLIEEAGGLKPFDFRPFGYSLDEAETYLGAISEEGVSTYLGLQHQLDLAYPLVLAAMFIVGFRRFLGPVSALVLTVIAVAGAVADYSENALVSTMLTEAATPDQIALASTATQIKSASATICFTVLLVIAVRAVLGRRKAGA